MTDATSSPAVSASDAPARRLLPLVAIVFLGFLAIGLPLPALPMHVHGVLDFGTAAVGWVIGIQSFVTVLTRQWAGRLIDRHGPRRMVLRGLPLAAVAGVLYLASTWVADPSASLAVLVTGRVLMGIGESLFLTGAMTWGIARVGPARTGMVMSWQGIAMFTAVGLGAPLGIATMARAGFAGVAVAAIVLPLIGWLVAWRLPGAAPASARTAPRADAPGVLGLIWRPGLVLTLATVAFAVLTAFVVLYFDARGWEGAGAALTAFAVGYIGVRLVAGRLPDRVGGTRVARVSLAVEFAGLLLMWAAPGAGWAIAGGALVGMGFSLMFPSMGVEAMRRVPPQARGLAVGSFTAFFDLTVGLTGPVVGALIGRFGYGSAFLVAAAACLAAWAMACLALSTRRAA